jgi:hypothetical protein
VTAAAALLLAATAFPAAAHEAHQFSAGEAGNPKKPARIVQVVMRDGDGKMWSVLDSIKAHKGEQPASFFAIVVHSSTSSFWLASKKIMNMPK